MTDFPIKLRVKPTLNAFKMSSTLDAYFGTKPPPVKKKKTEEERLEVQRKYDKEERNRKFSNAWEKSFKWVEYDEETGMRCKVCIQYENKGQFIVGCKNYRLEALKIHENSEVHKVNVKRETVKSMQPAESQAEKSLLMMKRAAFAKMTILFRNAHYIAKNNRPYTDYVSLCQLDKAKNLDIGETYMSDRACQKFVHAISAARQSEQDEIINNSKFISIISDGSTDVSSKEAEIVYLRCSHKARVSTLFIGLKNVPKADGYNISCAIDSIMTDRFQDTWKGKLIAMGTDGASVMLGKSSGVIKRISDSINKPVHAIHCSAHRIELAYKDAIKEVKIWQRCDALMLNIYLFYKYSPLNRSNLNASFVSLGKKMLTPTRVGGTRWVPHHERALTTLLHGKEAIIQHLEQMQAPGEARKDQSAKGRNFLKALKDKQVVFWLHFMLDVIKALSSLSRSIQTKNSTVGDVYNELEACKAIMTNYMKSDGPNVRKFLNAYNEMEKLLESSRKAFLSKLVQSITTRFEGDMHLFKGSTVLSFHKWPGSLEDEPEFGNSHISELVEVCRPNLGDEIVDCIEAEWTRFKQELYSSKQPLQSYTWDVAADRYMSSYPNLFMLVDYLLTLPSCSVDAERGFSSMKMIKNDWRSRLGSQNLSDLILVSLETASVEVYDPTKAINMWNTGGIRSKRPFYKDELKKIVVESPDQQMTLLQYLRRVLLLPGTKEACGQGGCGSCTVMISQYTNDGLVHFSANACLTPICYLHGMAVTTVEGVGGTDNGLHPIQKSLVESHGLQCGFCTPGMVMTMYTLFHNIPQPTADQMERALEGNLCRCTGYRPIIDAFKQAAKECPCGLGLCTKSEETVPSNNSTDMTSEFMQKKDPTQSFIFPSELQTNSDLRKTRVFTKGDYKWYKPCCLSDLIKIKEQNPEATLLMGCTAVGYLLRTGLIKSKTIICGSNVTELSGVDITDTDIVIGSAVTMRELELVLNKKSPSLKDYNLRMVEAIQEGIRWIAADQIRNVATIGGHLMSIAPNHDLQTLFMAVGAQLNFIKIDSNGKEHQLSRKLDEDFMINRPGVDSILKSISVPLTKQNQYVKFYKQPGRRGFDYAVTNAGIYLELEENSHVVKSLKMSCGNIERRPILMNSVTKAFVGRKLEDVPFSSVLPEFVTELALIKDAEDLKFKTTLATSFFYKFYADMHQELKTLNGIDPSAIDSLPLEPSSGIQIYDVPDSDGKHAVWQPIPNVGSDYIVSGEAVFIDDMPQLANEYFAAIVTSTRAHARVISVDASDALALPGVQDFVTSKDIPGHKYYGPMIKDQDIFAEKEVLFYGHPIGAIVADTRETARKAAKSVKIEYEDLEPVLTIEDAIQKNSMFPLGLNIDEGDMDKALSEAAHIVTGEVECHAQEHVYLEPHTAMAVPRVEQKELDIYSSTQAPLEIQDEVASFLNLSQNRINVRVRRLGGAFGGKGPDSILVSAVAAICAWKTKHPVRCVLDRATDFRITGKRHPMKTLYKAAVNDEGKLLGLELDVYLNCGWNLAVSYFVLTCCMPYNSPYQIPAARMRGYLCKTNTPSNVAFRGFGTPQRQIYLEKIMAAISHQTRQPMNKVQEINFVNEGDTILANVKLENIYLRQCWEKCKQQAHYDERLAEIQKFNSKNKWKKRGIGMNPIVFNLGYPYHVMNQAYAMVNLFLDGTVLVTHGGVEMGQGLHTKMQQVASTVLQIPMSDILIGETQTNVVNLPAESGGSFVAEINGQATKIACEALMERLKPFKEANPEGKFKDWVAAAFSARVKLVEMAHYKVPGSDKSYDFDKREGYYAMYFTHNAACSEVEIDCLTGEHQLLKTDIVMDVGQSLNPAIDVGQVEGGFIQGYGLCVTEALHLRPNGQVKNSGPLDYKIPGVRNIPRNFNVTFLKDSQIKKSLYSSKGLGEPPLLLGVSVHNALEEAVKAAREDQGLTDYYQLPCPATVDKIRMGCSDDITKQIDKIMPSVKESGILL